MASAPFFTLTPTCKGENNCDALTETAALAHLLTSRRQIFPITIGRTPPLFFFNAIKGADDTKGAK